LIQIFEKKLVPNDRGKQLVINLFQDEISDRSIIEFGNFALKETSSSGSKWIL
jgi:hypothetical protein